MLKRHFITWLAALLCAHAVQDGRFEDHPMTQLTTELVRWEALHNQGIMTDVIEYNIEKFLSYVELIHRVKDLTDDQMRVWGKSFDLDLYERPLPFISYWIHKEWQSFFTRPTPCRWHCFKQSTQLAASGWHPCSRMGECFNRLAGYVEYQDCILKLDAYIYNNPPYLFGIHPYLTGAYPYPLGAAPPYQTEAYPYPLEAEHPDLATTQQTGAGAAISAPIPNAENPSAAKSTIVSALAIGGPQPIDLSPADNPLITPTPHAESPPKQLPAKPAVEEPADKKTNVVHQNVSAAKQTLQETAETITAMVTSLEALLKQAQKADKRGITDYINQLQDIKTSIDCLVELKINEKTDEEMKKHIKDCQSANKSFNQKKPGIDEYMRRVKGRLPVSANSTKREKPKPAVRPTPTEEEQPLTVEVTKAPAISTKLEKFRQDVCASRSEIQSLQEKILTLKKEAEKTIENVDITTAEDAQAQFRELTKTVQSGSRLLKTDLSQLSRKGLTTHQSEITEWLKEAQNAVKTLNTLIKDLDQKVENTEKEDAIKRDQMRIEQEAYLDELLVSVPHHRETIKATITGLCRAKEQANNFKKMLEELAKTLDSREFTKSARIICKINEIAEENNNLNKIFESEEKTKIRDWLGNLSALGEIIKAASPKTLAEVTRKLSNNALQK